MNSPLLRFLCPKSNYLNFRAYISLIFVLFYLIPTVYAQNTKLVEWERFDQSENVKPAQLIESLKEKGLILNEKQLKLKKSKTSKNGMNHTSYQQYKNGIPIENAFLTCHSRRGNIISASNNLIESTNLKTTIPRLTKSDAVEKALGKIGAKKYSWEDEKFDQLLKNNKRDSNYSSYPNPELCYVDINSSQKVVDYVLAYKMEIYSLEPHGKVLIYIDAEDGKFLKELELLHGNCSDRISAFSDEVEILCSGEENHENCAGGISTLSEEVETLYNGDQDITTNLFEGNYELVNCESEIQTFIMVDDSNVQSNSSIGSSSNIDFLDFDSDAQKAALSVHWATEHTYDFFLSEGIDGNDVFDGPVSSYVNYGRNDEPNERNNAFYNGSFLTYGAGPIGSETGTFTGPVATADVVAHEFGHATTKFQSLFGDIEYQGESGAINESFADIFSVLVENYILENVGSDPTISPWIIGEAVTVNGLRSMSSPKDLGQPDTYGGDFWADPNGTYDRGGVHINSGVMNYWFYLLSEGDAGQNDLNFDYNIEGIGLADAFSILLESYNFLPSRSPSFTDMRNATILASETFFEGCLYTQVIIDAWDAVNVGIGETFGNCVFFAQIEQSPTQFCEGSSGVFSSKNLNSSFTEKWYLNDVPVSNPISFPDLGRHTLKLELKDTNTGELKFDEISIFVVTCEPIVDERGTMYFGEELGFDFSSGKAEIISHDYSMFETNICQADDSGNILFYISGAPGGSLDLYDSEDNSLTDGETIYPISGSSFQIGASVPSPDGLTYNLIVNSSHQSSDLEGSSLYRLVVQIDEDTGMASLTSFDPVEPPNTSYDTNTQNALKVYDNTTVIPHSCDNNRFWIIAIAQDKTKILIYELDYSNGGEGTLEFHHTNINPNVFFLENYPSFPIEVSPDGSMLSLPVHIYSFDRTTGNIGSRIHAITRIHEAPVYREFSPDGRFLYWENSEGRLFQSDLSEGFQVTPREIYRENVLPYKSKITDFIIGPDDRLYIRSVSLEGISFGDNYNFGVINNPNTAVASGDLMYNENPFQSDKGGLSFPEYLKVKIPPPNRLYFEASQESCLEVELNAGSCFSEYTWNFGDGNTEVTTTEVTQHIYDEPGTYQLTLTVISDGETLTATQEVTLTGFIGEENLEITGPSTFCDEGFGYFSAPRSVSYTWSVDGNAVNVSDINEQNLYVTWGSDESYEISVVLEDENGCTTTLTKNVVKDPSCCEIPVTVRVRNITQDIFWTIDYDLAYEGCVGDDVRIWINSQTDIFTSNYEWNRGIPVNNAPFIVTADGPGYYQVTITSPDGCIEVVGFTYTEVCCDEGIASACWSSNLSEGGSWVEGCNVEACIGDVVRLQVRTNDSDLYYFNWEGGTETNSPDIRLADGSEEYNVTITSKSDDSCVGFKTITYAEDCCGVEGITSECWALNLSEGGSWESLDDTNCIFEACTGENVRLQVRTNDWTQYDFEWSGGTVLNADRPDIIRPDGTAVYSVTITSKSDPNCSGVKSIDYQEMCCDSGIASECWALNLSEGGSWESLDNNCEFVACEGENVRLQARTNDWTQYDFEWSGGTVLNADRPDIIRPDGTAVYSVTITSKSDPNCSGVKSIDYQEMCCGGGIVSECWARNVSEGGSWESLDDTNCIFEACTGENVRLQARTDDWTQYDFVWSDGTVVNEDRPDIIRPAESGTYTVTITNPLTNCIAIKSIFYSENGPNPLSCSYRNNTQGTGNIPSPDCTYTACEGDEVIITIFDAQSFSSTWEFEWSAGIPTGTFPPYSVFAVEGIEEYTLTISSPEGCSQSRTFTLERLSVCCSQESFELDCSINLNQGEGWIEQSECSYTSCIGEEIELSIIPDFGECIGCTWEWIGGEEGDISSTRIIQDPGDYSVMVTTAEGCTAETIFTLYDMICCEEGLPTICSYRNNTKNIDWTTTTDCEYTACEGDDVNLTILLDELPTDEWVWEWSDGGTVDQNDQTIFTPDGPGIYTVTITDENGCSTEGYFSYEEEYCCTEDDLLPLGCEYKRSSTGFIDASDCTFTGCEDEQILIRITTPYSPSNDWEWTWSEGTTLTGSLYENIVSVSEPDMYSVTVTDENGCTTTKIFDYIQEQPLELNCSYNNLSDPSAGWLTSIDCSALVCDGDEVEITIAPDGGGGADWTWEWSNNGISIGASDGNTILAGTPGIYSVTVTTDLGCSTTQTFTLEGEPCCNDPEPFALTCKARNLTQGGPFQISPDCSYTICEGDEVQLFISADNGCAGCSYDWSPGTTPGNIPLIVNVTESGNYSVDVTNADGCTSTATFMITEEFCCEEIALTCRYNNLSGEIGWVTSEDCSLTSCIDDDVRIAFITQGEPFSSLTWDWNAGDADPDFPYIITPDGSGTYTVTVTDENQCTTVGTFEYLEEYCCIDGMTLSCSYNNLSDPDTDWVDAPNCNYVSCDSDEVIIQITSPYEPNPDWTWNWSAGSSGELPSNQILATGETQYTVTITDEFGCTATGMFDLEIEECCETEELVNADYQLGFELRPNEGGFPYQECAVTLVDLNYLFDFCEDLVCCPSGIEGIAGTLIIYSNDEPVATLNLAPSSDRMLCISDQLEFTTADLSMCFPSSDKAEVGDVITATYNITEIISECELNTTSLNVSAVPYLVTLEDVLSCCDDPAAILECSYNNLTEVSGWVDAEDCTYTACSGDEVQIEISTAQEPDPNWTWQWEGGGTLTNSPNIIIANGAGTYTVILTDSQGSTVSKSFILEETCCIAEPFALTCKARNLTQGGGFVTDPDCSYMACEGDEVQLFISADDGCAGCSYDWSPGTTPGNIPLIVSVTSLGEYFVTVTNADGCTSTATFELTEDCGVLLSAPVDQEISKVGMENGNLYGFDFDDETISIDEKTMSRDNDLQHEKEIDKKNGFLSKGMFDENTKELVYPNPFTDEFNLSFLAETSDKYTLIFYDINGKIIKSMLGEVNKGRNMLVIDDLGNIAVGAYFYRLTTSNQQITGKIIKQR